MTTTSARISDRTFKAASTAKFSHYMKVAPLYFKTTQTSGSLTLDFYSEEDKKGSMKISWITNGINQLVKLDADDCSQQVCNAW